MRRRPGDPSEKQFMAQVLQLARLCGWRAFHDFDSRRSAPGLPDLLLVRRGVLLFRELKVGSNQPTAEQRAWLDDLGAVREVSAGLWYPTDWDAIQKTLTGG